MLSTNSKRASDVQESQQAVSTADLQNRISDFFQDIRSQMTEPAAVTDEKVVFENLSIIRSLIRAIESGDRERQKNAAKAIGYLALADVINAKERLELKQTLIDRLADSSTPISSAFNMLEALERVDAEHFWTLVMAWYGIATGRGETVGRVVAS